MFSLEYIQHQFEECSGANDVVKKQNEIIESIGFLINTTEIAQIEKLAAKEFSKKRRAVVDRRSCNAS